MIKFNVMKTFREADISLCLETMVNNLDPYLTVFQGRQILKW